jgi:hypothetical protein
MLMMSHLMRWSTLESLDACCLLWLLCIEGATQAALNCFCVILLMLITLGLIWLIYGIPWHRPAETWHDVAWMAHLD